MRGFESHFCAEWLRHEAAHVVQDRQGRTSLRDIDDVEFKALVVSLAYIVFIPQFQTTFAESYERRRETTWLSHEDTGIR